MSVREGFYSLICLLASQFTILVLRILKKILVHGSWYWGSDSVPNPICFRMRGWTRSSLLGCCRPPLRSSTASWSSWRSWRTTSSKSARPTSESRCTRWRWRGSGSWWPRTYGSASPRSSLKYGRSARGLSIPGPSTRSCSAGKSSPLLSRTGIQFKRKKWLEIPYTRKDGKMRCSCMSQIQNCVSRVFSR